MSKSFKGEEREFFKRNRKQFQQFRKLRQSKRRTSEDSEFLTKKNGNGGFKDDKLENLYE